MIVVHRKDLYLISVAAVSVAVICLFFWLTVLRDAPAVSYNFEGINTNQAAVNFFKQFGWEVSPEPIETAEITIPTEFNEVYNNYNKLQKKLGLDLSKYKGKTVKRLTYKVLNHPMSSKTQVRGNILLYNDRVIAGDIMSVELGGFMQSLLPEN